MTSPPLLVILDPLVLDDLAIADCLDMLADSPDVRLAVSARARAAGSELARIAIGDIEKPPGVRAFAARQRPPFFDEDGAGQTEDPLVLVTAPGSSVPAPSWPHVAVCCATLSGALHDRLPVAEALKRSTAAG